MNHSLFSAAALPPLLLAGCSSGNSVGPSGTGDPSAAVTTQAPTPSPAPTRTLPAELPGGWLRGTNPDFDIEVQKLVDRFNDKFPDANLAGSAYENKRLDDNGLIVMIGEKGLDDSEAALSLFEAGPVKETERVTPTTYCGMTEIEKKAVVGRVGGHVMCLTVTTPTVVIAYFPFEADKRAFTLKKPADLASSLQGDL